MKIGITTLHGYNYGSVLQCFATQEYLRQRGCEVEVIDTVATGNPPVNSLCVLTGLVWRCVAHPLHARSIVRHFLAQRSSRLTLTPASVMALRRFEETALHRKTYTLGHLRRLAHSEAFDYFFSGSDQVWNGARIDGYERFFLRFAPREKRVGWAASFGSHDIAPYNRQRYRRYLADYGHLSVRERSGQRILRQLTGKEAPCLPDPVMLFSAAEWRAKSAAAKQAKPYVLAFFIDPPSDKAREAAEMAAIKLRLPLRTFGYRHDSLATADHEDGGPQDFIAAVDGATCVLTDSFHAVAFSVLLHKPFFAYRRSYAHDQDQSARLTDFLDEVQLSHRYERQFALLDADDFTAAEAYLKQQRQAADHFVTRLIGPAREPRYMACIQPRKADCCGCGACADACARRAITLKPDSEGHTYPTVDAKRCNGCGRCVTVCAFSTKDNAPAATAAADASHKAYIAAAKDRQLIRASASGGVFAVLAKDVLAKGGTVYGASLDFEEERPRCRHERIERLVDLHRLQGSKYVQSATTGTFARVRQDLKDGKQVLFSGTSCQVAALRRFLGRCHEGLLTIDLICHGVPPEAMLHAYIDSLHTGGKVTALSFRQRERRGLPYCLGLTLTDSHQRNRTRRIGLRSAAYYRLYMARSGYRPACYNCPYTSPQKPADITLGDYCWKESPTSLRLTPALQQADRLSTVITHGRRGEQALDALKEELTLQTADLHALTADHEQLRRPSLPSRWGETLLANYREGGFESLQRTVNRLNALLWIPACLKRMVRRR